MNIEKMFEMQKELDMRIIKEHGLEGQDLLPNTVLALQVEIAELANEWRGFKHWSNNREPGNTLEEYVDCLHLFLSIARQLNLPEDDFCITDEVERSGTTVLFIELLKNVGMINDIPKKYKQQFL
ncbi:dUTP diphosphatase, partial [Paenibacillus larvae]